MKITCKCFFKAVELERGGPVVDWTLLAIFFLLLFIGNISKWSLKAVFVIGINKSKVHSELAVSKNCTKVLSKQIETLQRNALDSWQYLRREMIEINLVPGDIQDMQLEESICQEWDKEIGWLPSSPAEQKKWHYF